MDFIYQVWGQHGLYVEEQERNLLATYSDKALADEHVRLAIERKAELNVRYEKYIDQDNEWMNYAGSEIPQPLFRGRSVYDKHLAHEYGIHTDRTYQVLREPVRAALPRTGRK